MGGKRWMIAFMILICGAAFTSSSGIVQVTHERAVLAIPAEAQTAISNALGSDDATYQARPTESGYRVENARHHIKAEFNARGAHTGGGMQWDLSPVTWGYGDKLQTVAEAVPIAHANRVEFQRGAMTEWYVNGPLGLEQGFTIAAPPENKSGEPSLLTLALELGDRVAQLDPDGSTLTLSAPNGEGTIRYGGLSAADADGQPLRAWMEKGGTRLLVRVEAAGARYPIMIDPWVQNAKLTASDGAVGDLFGYSIAMSGDTIVIGAPFDTIGLNTHQGSAYVFVKPVSGWTNSSTFTAKLTASDGAADDIFGISVAIDGDTIVVGADGVDLPGKLYAGAAYVFVRPPGGVWETTSAFKAKLTASDYATTTGNFGMSVGISGNTIIAGMETNDWVPIVPGTVYVFAKPEAGWSTITESARLTIGSTSADRFARTVAISGSTIVAGATTGLGADAVYVFVQPEGAPWATTSTYNAKLQSGVAYSTNFGFSLAVSGDTVVVGASGFKAHVFVKPTLGWSNMTGGFALTPSDPSPGDMFASSVAISGDTVVVGALQKIVNSNIQAGAAYVFVKPGAEWTNMAENANLIPSDSQYRGFFGASVATSGSVVAVGTGYMGNPTANGAGSAYVFGTAATKAATTTTITGSVPATSLVGQAVTVSFSVTPNPPATGTPTGTVTVSDGGSVHCTASVATGSCSLTFITGGSKTLTAIYSGDTNFLTSTSSSYAMQVKYGLYLPLAFR